MSEEQEFADFEVDLGEGFSEVNPWGGEQRPVPPAGTGYKLTIENLKQDTIGQGTPAIIATFVITDHEDTSLNNTKVWNNYPLTPKAAGRLKQLMIAGGGTLSKFVAAEYIGVTILADIIHSMSEGGVGPDGNTRAPRVFANVCNERPLDPPAPEAKAETPTPPVMKAKPANGAADKAAKPGTARRA